ncbi:hypothetical protein [Thalassospira xiamenensis]|uniref:hypothetical protein n=1 Tax=Thalassospira xiamenensis TaxID=220697 RepID=UPI000BE39AC1|nr:hypothetical protein [Thalassospira xiamenensis]
MEYIAKAPGNQVWKLVKLINTDGREAFLIDDYYFVSLRRYNDLLDYLPPDWRNSELQMVSNFVFSAKLKIISHERSTQRDEFVVVESEGALISIRRAQRNYYAGFRRGAEESLQGIVNGDGAASILMGITNKTITVDDDGWLAGQFTFTKRGASVGLKSVGPEHKPLVIGGDTLEQALSAK